MPVKHNILKVYYRDEVVEAWYNNFKFDPDEGFDLIACEDVKMQPNSNKVIDLGIIMKPPAGYRIEVVMRSSAFKHFSLILANHYGIIDPSYCGEKDYLKAHVIAFGNPTTITKGSRIAQAILRKIVKIDKVEKFNPSEKSRGGFGSTGGVTSR